MNRAPDPWDNDYRRRGRLWGGSARGFHGITAASRILELGCGDGKTVSQLVQRGCQVTAIDLSPHAAMLCRHACTDPDPPEILIADARKTPFLNETFDIILASHIAGHLTAEGRRELADEVFRLLVPGGMLHFCDFSCDDFRYGRGTETGPGTFVRNNGIATHYFTDTEVLEMFLGLAAESLSHHRWSLRVRGMLLPRAEIVARFRKRA